MPSDIIAPVDRPPGDRPPARGAARRWLPLVIAVLAVAAALLLDGWAYRALYDTKVYERDWGRLFRVMGYLPTWLLAAIALALVERRREAAGGAMPMAASREGAIGWRRRALLLAITPAITGLAAELLKLVLRRERPNDGVQYVWRALSDGPFSNRGLGLPSSHAMVAFGAASILARLWPEARIVWYLLAAGCALTRVMARAHWASDVTVAALAAWAIVALVWRRWGRWGRVGADGR